MKPEYLGLVSLSSFMSGALRRNRDFANGQSGLSEYLRKRNRDVRCGKCNGRKTRAHAHGCPKRRACHAGYRLRKIANSIFWEMGDRRTGRTTRNLYAAFVQAYLGKNVVVMVANEREVKRCKDIVRGWPKTDGKIEFVKTDYTGRGDPPTKIFVDHFAYDVRPRASFRELEARGFQIA